MAASGGSSKAKAAPVPGPSVVSQNRPSNSGTSVQVLIKASPSVAPSEDESTIKVLPKKDNKEKSSSGSGGTIKLKKPVPKHNKPGNWRDGSVVEGMSSRILRRKATTVILAITNCNKQMIRRSEQILLQQPIIPCLPLQVLLSIN